MIFWEHWHCERCKTRIPTGYTGAVSDDLVFALRESGANYELYGRGEVFPYASMGYRGLCDRCAREKARTAVVEAIKHDRKRYYENGYNRKPASAGLLGFSSICPFCDTYISDSKCPKCDREYNVPDYMIMPFRTTPGKKDGGKKK
jgi:hypothetical protein